MVDTWLVAVGSTIAHIPKMGRESVYGLGRKPMRPDPALKEVLCGARPDWWAVATVDLLAFEPDEAYEACPACCKAAGIKVPAAPGGPKQETLQLGG